VAVQPPQATRPAVDGPIVTIGETGHFGTLGEAVLYLERNAMSSTPIREIQITGATPLRGNVVIDNSRFGLFPKGLRITGVGDKPGVLIGAADEPVLTINDIEGLTLENLTIDCSASKTGVVLRGYVSGTRLVNVGFDNVKTHAVLGIGVNGLAGQEFALERCRFQGADEKSELVRFEPSEVGNTRKIAVRGCRFLGPANAGLSLVGTATDVTIRECLFHSLRDAVRVTGSDQQLEAVLFANNTFHEFTRGVAFESPSISSAKGVSFTQNLFAAGKGAEVSLAASEIDVDKLASGVPASQSNWSDQSEVTDSLRLPIFKNNGIQGQPVQFVSTDPGHGEFLKPLTPELRTLVKQPVGPLNFVGAVRP